MFLVDTKNLTPLPDCLAVFSAANLRPSHAARLLGVSRMALHKWKRNPTRVKLQTLTHWAVSTLAARVQQAIKSGQAPFPGHFSYEQIEAALRGTEQTTQQ